MQPAALTTGQHFIQAFSWMLIHSLWQGLLLSVIVGLLLTAGKKSSAALRYNLVLTQLLLFVIACGGTFLWEWSKEPVQSAGIHFSIAPSDDASSVKAFVNTCIAYFTANSPVIVLLWFILFLVRTVRMMGSAIFINRARHRFIYQPSDAWKAKMNLFCEKLLLKRAVQLLESGYVNVPMVVGHLKPVILIPIGLLAGLPPGQVEAVLLHELAHIRRNDYVVNCLQTIVETVFFFNPGLLWISSVLRDERENCCDDIALAQTQNKKEFVQALISFKEYALECKNCVVAFPGDKNSLLNRASRILYNQNKPLGTGEKMFFLTAVLVLSIIVATASVARMHVSAKNKLSADAIFSAHQTTAAARALTLKVDTEKKQVYNSKPFKSYFDHKAAKNMLKVFRSVAAKMPGGLSNNQNQSTNDQQSVRRNLDAKVRDLQSAKENKEASKRDRAAVLRDQQAAKRDQQNTAIETKKAHQQARTDEAETNKDELIALRDKAQAKKDQQQALQDQVQALRDQQQADKDQSQAKLEQEQAQRDQAQAKKDEQQATHDQIRAKNGQFQKWDGQNNAVELKMQMAMQMQVQQQKEATASTKFEEMLKKRKDTTGNSSHVSIQ